jgi:hypothetical protein
LPDYQPIADKFRFDFVVVRRGKFKLLFGEALKIAKQGRKKRKNKWYKIKIISKPEPRQPTIQKLLKKALEYDWRLKANPILNKARLAAEAGVSQSYLTRLLHLINLAPEIQDYIQKMPASVRYSPITENRIRYLARSNDQGFQISEFNRIKQLGCRARIAAVR